MRTLILLAAATFTVASATAQEANNRMIANDPCSQGAICDPQALTVQPTLNRIKQAGKVNAKTTGAHSRWYNYGDYLADAYTTAFSAIYLWNDSTSVDAYTGDHSSTVYQFNNMASVGYVCDPFYPLWNDVAAYPGVMSVSPVDNYVIDSVYISGIYQRNDNKPMPVDTLTVAIIYGDGSDASDLHYKAIDTTGGRAWIHDEYGVDSLFYMNMKHDSANNRADTFMGGVTPYVTKIYLTNTDTSVNYEAVIPVSINVPAGNRPAMSLSFKSGDPTFVFGDTVFMGSASPVPYKYGMFRPFVTYVGISGTPSFAINSKDDLNEGEFRDVGYNKAPNGVYRPHWFWYNATTSGAATYQYPYFAFHISCATCAAVGVNDVTGKAGDVNVYPNPANTEVTIAFDAMKGRKGSVVLTDVVGRQVVSKDVEDVASGKVSINTASLPGGVYLYSLIIDGARVTGRIVVAH